MVIYFTPGRNGKRYAYVCVADVPVYIGPKDGFGKKELENIMRGLDILNQSSENHEAKINKDRAYLLGRLGKLILEKYVVKDSGSS